LTREGKSGTHADDVVDDLLPQVHSDVHRLRIRRVVIAVNDELESSSLDGVAEEGRQISSHRAELDGSKLDLQLAAFERGVVEKLVDHVEEANRVTLDEVELLTMIRL